MLISPPFLSTPQGLNESDAAFVARNMSGGTPGDGAYPVSFNFQWHTGLHVDGPNAPVRAIADGKIKWVSPQITAPTTDDVPLNYHAGWTSDGVVVIEHTTDIGENVTLTYYSVYQHLSVIANGISTGRPIYRKDEIGRAGYLYGAPNKFHFEICCDDDNLGKLIGRTSGKLDLSKDGRTDALWGEMYFALPKGTPIYALDMRTAQQTQPADQEAADKAKEAADKAEEKRVKAQQAADAAAQAADAAPHNAALRTRKTQTAHTAERASHDADTAQAKAKAAQDKAGAYSHALAQSTYVVPDGQPLFVGMTYERGECTMTTYEESGKVIGTVDEPIKHYEYQLYEQATKLYPACASAGYELLRFGRIVGPDALDPANAKHWRKVAYPGGEGWVDLRPDAIKKFSDADFPHWRGWTLIDDDTDGDARCDSPMIKKMVLEDEEKCYEETQANERLKNPDVQAKLKRTICKVPSAWDPTDPDKRWGWLKQDKPEDYSPLLNRCMSDDDFNKLKAHIQALAFWDKAGMGDKPYWYFNPKEFIAVFRHCGWLSLREMTQLLPRRSVAGGQISWIEAVRRFTNGYPAQGTPTTPPGLHLSINKGFRKYLLLTPLRQAHFFGQMLQETGALTLNTEKGGERYFRTMYEVITPAEAGEDYDDRPNGIAWRLRLVYKRVNGQSILRTRDEYMHDRPPQVHAKALELGNTQPGDGPRFRGRGLIQVTGRANYELYGKYRGGLDFTTDPNPEMLANDTFVSSDLSLKYWVSKHWVYAHHPGEHKGVDINQLADDGDSDEAIEGVTRAVNGGTTHIEHRREYFGYAWGLMRDMPTPPDTEHLKRQKE